jgi:hypothetical protein
MADVAVTSPVEISLVNSPICWARSLASWMRASWIAALRFHRVTHVMANATMMTPDGPHISMVFSAIGSITSPLKLYHLPLVYQLGTPFPQ